jgi:hypothetical protein
LWFDSTATRQFDATELACYTFSMAKYHIILGKRAQVVTPLVGPDFLREYLQVAFTGDWTVEEYNIIYDICAVMRSAQQDGHGLYSEYEIHPYDFEQFITKKRSIEITEMKQFNLLAKLVRI